MSESPAWTVCTRAGHCPVCARPNRCRMESGEAFKGPCWCEAPQLSAEAAERLENELLETRCLCARCLTALAADPAISWERLAGLDEFYWEGENVVFTAQFLRNRGYCCESGCRHCPY